MSDPSLIATYYEEITSLADLMQKQEPNVPPELRLDVQLAVEALREAANYMECRRCERAPAITAKSRVLSENGEGELDLPLCGECAAGMEQCRVCRAWHWWESVCCLMPAAKGER